VIGQDTTSLLRIEHLFKSFQDRLVLNDLNLEILPNSVLGLLGPNGAGKTTLLKIASGLLSPDSGTIITTKFQLGYCPQTPVFWKKITTIEQLFYNSDLFLIPRQASKFRINFLIEKLGLSSYESQYVERLSGGMQKRLNLAMALVHHPKLLMLDEPTANLDLESKEYVRNLLKYLVKEEGISILCSSHDLDEISLISDEILFMNHGQIVHSERMTDEIKYASNYERLKDLYKNIITGQVKP